VLVGSDGSKGAAQALRAAGALAERLGAKVVVGHVQRAVQDPAAGEFVAELREDLELAVLLQAGSILDPLGVPWELALECGDAAYGLSRLADLHSAALVVIGTRGCGAGQALRRIVAGSVSSHLVHHERRPVLVVPPPVP
jgi:nucleotide-binding universal stress UspA family protein